MTKPPSLPESAFTNPQIAVDVLARAKFEMAISPNAGITVLGDAVRWRSKLGISGGWVVAIQSNRPFSFKQHSVIWM
jgi:hypothetical protein